MGSSRKWHHSCTAGLISTDKQQKLSAHAMFSSPPSKNKRECLELLENLTSRMLYISLVFSPQATSQKYRWSTDCPVSQPFPLQFAACLPCYQGFLPFVATPACLPRKAGALVSNSTAKAVVFAPPHSVLTFAFSLVILAQFSKVYHRTSRARDGTFFSIPQSCFSIMSLTAPSHPRLIKFHHLLQWGNFLTDMNFASTTGTLYIYLLVCCYILQLASPLQGVPATCAQWDTVCLSFSVCYIHLKEGSWWCFFIGGHHLPLEASKGCSTG